MKEHEKRVWSVEFSLADPTMEQVLVPSKPKPMYASTDNTLKLWDLSMSTSRDLDCPLQSYTGHLNVKDEEDTLEEAFSNMSQWVSGENTSLSGYEGRDQSSEGWLAICSTDAEVIVKLGEINSDFTQLDPEELCAAQSEENNEEEDDDREAESDEDDLNEIIDV
ncbi:hypothetical protein AgCh_000075 [Apium graveolens]